METREITYLVVFTLVIFSILVAFVISMLVNYYRKNRAYNNALVEMRHKMEQEVLKAQLEIQEQTLKNISQEIHDNIGQALTLAKLNLNTMQVTDEELKDKISNSKQLVGKAISDLRSLSHSLDTDYIKEMGLVRAIEYELEMIRKSGTMGAILEINGNPVRLDKHKELILFRIVQESLNNIIKHSGAGKILIQLTYTVRQLALSITDDGLGMDLSPLNENNNSFGLGIKNMHSRATLIGADFNMQSKLQEGTTLKILLPLENVTDEIEG